MARRAEPAEELKPHEWTLSALRKQLESLQRLKGQRGYQEAHDEESGWYYLTESIIERGFGKSSSNVVKFKRASLNPPPVMVFNFGAGPSVDHREQQVNFENRIRQYEIVLNSIIDALKLEMPEEEIKGAYEAGEEYAFYKDLKGIIEPATREVLIADNYIDDQVFDIYVNRVGPSVMVHVLTRQISGAVKAVAEKYARSHSAFELRTTNAGHDRIVFVDDRCWVIGQSIKDAASKKPTYIVEVDHSMWRPIYEGLWTNATRVI